MILHSTQFSLFWNSKNSFVYVVFYVFLNLKFEQNTLKQRIIKLSKNWIRHWTRFALLVKMTYFVKKYFFYYIQGGPLMFFQKNISWWVRVHR